MFPNHALHLFRLLFIVLIAGTLVSCGGDIGSTTGTQTPPPAVDPVINPTIDPVNDTVDGGDFSISVPTTLSLIEGSDGIAVAVQAFRTNGHNRPITLTLDGVQAADTRNLTAEFSRSTLETGVNQATLSLRVDVGMAPITVQQRSLELRATDGEQTVQFILDVAVQPINAPDVYLLIGQSNMVGFSLSNAKDAGPGGLDEPDPRIFQLNATANDAQNFGSPEKFTDGQSIAAFPRIVQASDPLHQSFDPSLQGKSGTHIGLGLTFAKSALPDTSQNIVLVPAAWSGSSFCNNGFEHIAWNAVTPAASQAHLGGTALHDRAIARANLALTETGGILRGILWHQGETDATEAECANDYASNLTALIQSLRTNIQLDARGADARGPNAELPFILGTLSRGNDERGNFSDYDAFKTIIDNTHRTLPSQLGTVALSNHDDLIPTAFPCGQSSCIHFGASAYREMGRRYYEQLNTLWTAP